MGKQQRRFMREGKLTEEKRRENKVVEAIAKAPTVHQYLSCIHSSFPKQNGYSMHYCEDLVSKSPLAIVQATEMGLRIREMSYHKIKLTKIMSRITGKPEAQVEEDTDRDNFMNPWEAKEYGLIDEVIDDGKPGLVAPFGDTTAPPKTKVWDMWKVEGTKKSRKNLPSEQRISDN